MASFALFIEQTILVAGVSGVHTPRTTSQLIPFIIGVFSLAVALRDTLMLLLRKVNEQNSRFVKQKHPLTKPDLLEISGMEQTSLRVRARSLWQPCASRR
jgi:hypothetical protein